MDYVIGIFKATENGGAVLMHIMGMKPMDWDAAEKKVDVYNRLFGWKTDWCGCFTPDEGDLYAMFDHKEDMSPELVGCRVM